MDVCVFCGSRDGARPEYGAAADAAGRAIAARGRLVYGGGKVGLMGRVADAALDAGGEVLGIMPRALVEAEIAHDGLTRLMTVETMHERKAAMASESDAFLTLPGGMGTFEEIFEQITWAQLGIHAKPCGFLNVGGYYDPLKAMIDRVVEEGFMRAEYRDMLVFGEEIEAVLDAFAAHEPPAPKWSERPVKP
ncbi:TIGR00730 family Rossman fold protein [Roseobacter sp. HKCCA0434]|uniref:LOG family protein n=1 Tax=Roseobacter sp. HKCCA0434 TaxID=3079297 RepID=UPI002905802D|nr:TIGR00730 family Rossman fold protein [Roseobacter sp. HKCCA0434]